MKYWQWSSESSWVRMTRCISVSINSWVLSQNGNRILIVVIAYLDEVDLCESLEIPRSLDIQDGNDVLVVEISQQLHLSQRSQTEHGVIERGDLLDSDFLARRLVQC